MNLSDYEYLMSLALDQAEKAYDRNEVPVGAIITNQDGKILSRAYNLKECEHNPCGHAEILAILNAAKKIQSWRLINCHLVVTLEPCLMCLAASLQARLSRITFGAYDSKGGSLSLNYNFYKDQRLNHSLAIVGGIHHYECSRIMGRFFKEKRAFYKSSKPWPI